MCAVRPAGGSFSFRTGERTQIYEAMPCAKCIVAALRSGITLVSIRLPHCRHEIRSCVSVLQDRAAERSEQC